MTRGGSLALLLAALGATGSCRPMTSPVELGEPTRVSAEVARRLDDPLKLECLSSAQKGMSIEWPDMEGERVDFIGISKKSLRGLRTTDVVDLTWQQEQEITRLYVRVLREARTVVLVHFLESHLGGWIIDAVNWCDEPEVPTPIWL
jgi:hypothetical protein